MDLFELKAFVKDHHHGIELNSTRTDEALWKKTQEKMFGDESPMFPAFDRKLLRKQELVSHDLEWMGLTIRRSIWVIRHPVTFFGNTSLKNCGFLRAVEFIRGEDRLSLLKYPLEEPQTMEKLHTASSEEFASLVRFLVKSVS